MPRNSQRRVSSLKEECLELISSNLDKILECNNSKDDICNYRFVLGPLDDIPSHLISELIHHIKGKKKMSLKRSQLALLINPGLEILDYSRKTCHDSNNTQEISILIHYLSLRCRKVKKLSLAYYKKLPLKNLQYSFKDFSSNLSFLDLSHTNLSNETLNCCLQSCLNINYLDISSTPISDVQYLLPLSTLKYLNILFTHIIYQDSVRLFDKLKNNLNEFKCVDNIRILGRREESAMNNDKLYNYRFLYGGHDDLSRFQSCELAPESENYFIDVYENMTEISFVPLNSKTNFIKQLEITNLGRKYEFSMMSCLKEVFRLKGTFIDRLVLADICDVDVDLIIKNCRNIKNLQLLFNTDYIVNDEEGIERDSYCQLESLTLRIVEIETHDENSSPSTNQLKSLIKNTEKSSALKFLEIGYCNSITDEFWDLAFEDLETLHLSYCHNFSFSSLQYLLYLYNKLKNIHLEKCEHVTLSDISGYQSFCKAMLWDIDLLWS